LADAKATFLKALEKDGESPRRAKATWEKVLGSLCTALKACAPFFAFPVLGIEATTAPPPIVSSSQRLGGEVTESDDVGFVFSLLSHAGDEDMDILQTRAEQSKSFAPLLPPLLDANPGRRKLRRRGRRRRERERKEMELTPCTHAAGRRGRAQVLSRFLSLKTCLSLLPLSVVTALCSQVCVCVCVCVCVSVCVRDRVSA
jgi:hypothetical protein